MSAFPPVGEFTTAVLPNEHLFRGGFLKKAVILNDLDIQEHRKYIKLCTDNTTLRMFFSGQTRKRCHIQSSLFALVSELRDQKQDEWHKNAAPSVAPEDALLDSLGEELPDGLTSRAPAPKQLSALHKKALRKQFPYVVIDFPFGDETVGMRIRSVATKSEQPSVEASDENFRALFCWCRSEVAQTQGAPPTSKAVAVFEPRKTSEGREYYRKDRMCFYLLRDKKTMEAASSDSSSSIQRTDVCTRRTMGRPRKQARVAADSESSPLYGVSTPELDVSPGSESTDDPQSEF